METFKKDVHTIFTTNKNIKTNSTKSKQQRRIRRIRCLRNIMRKLRENILRSNKQESYPKKRRAQFIIYVTINKAISWLAQHSMQTKNKTDTSKKTQISLTWFKMYSDYGKSNFTYDLFESYHKYS